MSPKLTIVVNSTDSFEDCWSPFFTLFFHYWPNCPYPIVLNTETKDYAHPGLQIRTSKVGTDWNEEGRIPWSDCVIRCLNQIDSDYILYLQDDYFINGPVEADLINGFAGLMEKNDIAHIRLMELDIRAEYRPSKFHPLLWEISPSANYRVSMQAGLWSRRSLLSYLRPGESGWQFERRGTQRSYKAHELFLCQNLDEFNAKDRYPIPYKPTGIIKGKWWAEAMVDLFRQHGIAIDYEKRGFYVLDTRRRLIIWARAWARRLYMRYKWIFQAK